MDTNPEVEVTPEAKLEAFFAKQEAAPEPIEEEAEQAEDSEDVAEKAEAEAVEDQAPETEPDLDDVELEGETFKVPKKVKEAVLRQADYTQKTQEVAERRKVVEDREQYLQARETLLNEAFSEAAELQAIQTQLAQFDAVDWNTLVTEDAQQALRLNFARQQLQTQLAQKQQKVQEVVAKSKTAHEAHLAKQMELGRAELSRRVGKLTDPDRKATWEQGLSLGFSDKELQSIPDPRLMHALYKAAKWDALQAGKPALQKRIAEAKPMQAPAARSSGTTIEAAKREELKARVKKTGKSADAEAYLARLFESKRKR